MLCIDINILHPTPTDVSYSTGSVSLKLLNPTNIDTLRTNYTIQTS
jgi:hypothetical protein